MSTPFEHWRWSPPATWSVIEAVDLHTGGEPLRVIISGLPPLPGRTVLEKRQYFREHYDHLRTALMWEPRGHADMYGAVVTPSADADFDAFFLHNEGYSTMCGHALIALTKLYVETRLLPHADGEVCLVSNVPAGTVHARATLQDGYVHEASFRNVPSFLYLRDAMVEVAGIGRVRYDIAFGGAFYAIVDAGSIGLELTPLHERRLIDCGRRIKQALSQVVECRHPFEAELSDLYGVIFTGPAQRGCHSRNVCIFADGELDRSATGSGVSARAAAHVARGELAIGKRIVIESIIGSTMWVQAVERVRFGQYEAIVPEVGGTAFITGRHEFYFDPSDPLRRGFLLR